MSQTNICRQDKKYTKLLEREKAKNEESERKLNVSASKKQTTMTNERNNLKAKVLTVPKVMRTLICHLIWNPLNLALSYTNLQ